MTDIADARSTGELSGQVALVVGSAAGIGLASCQALAAKGASVIMADRDLNRVETEAASICASGGSAVPFQADVSSMKDLKGLFEFIARDFGRLNVFFSNAGLRSANGFDISEEQFDEAIALNLKHHYFSTNLAVPLMRPCAPKASIIYMASGAGLRFFGRAPLYSISKAALVMMARCFARQLGPDGIRVNALCPGAVDTEFARGNSDEEAFRTAASAWAREIPLRHIAQPGDIAGAVTFLASDAAAYITGVALPVDGGLMA